MDQVVTDAVASAPDKSLSTDSEESFLMRQINKSQLFNNTSSSSSSGNKNGSINNNNNNNNNRRSYFRESFIDADGTIQSFSVYQDVINESTDESRDVSLSGLSTFNMDHVNHEKILGDVELNNVASNNTKAQVSRGGSLREQHIRRNQSKRGLSNASANSSNIKLDSSKEQLPFTAPTSQYLDPTKIQMNSPNPILASRLAGNTGVPSAPTPDLSSQHERIPTPEFPAPPPPTGANVQTTPPVMIIQNDLSLEQMQLLRSMQSGPPRKAPSSDSFKSFHSNRESLLNYEDSRRKAKGIPHILVANAEKVVIKKVAHEPLIKRASNSIRGIIPSIHSPTNDDAGLGGRQTSVTTFDRLKLDRKPFTLKDFNLKSPGYTSDESSLGSQDGLLREKDMEPLFPHDSVLQRIMDNRQCQNRHRETNRLCSNRSFWLIYCLGFLIPPMFFFLGLGLLDTAIGHSTLTRRRLSVCTGLVWLLVALAMVGVGFGVGITRAA